MKLIVKIITRCLSPQIRRPPMYTFFHKMFSAGKMSSEEISVGEYDKKVIWGVGGSNK